MEKGFRSIDEQIEILKTRGLIIEDENVARDFLLNNNYYKVSGYTLTLREHNIFHENVSMDNVVQIYNFDLQFRAIILKYIGIIETKFKSIYTHEFCKLYGVTAYLEASNFISETKHSNIMNKAMQQKVRRLPHEEYLKYFEDEISKELPLWAFIDLLTISDISILYSCSKDKFKEIIANEFNYNVKTGSIILSKHMYSMTIIRNLCAHGSRIFNRTFSQKPSLNKNEKQKLIRDDNGELDNAHFYGFILIMKRLLSHNDFYKMIDELVELKGEYPLVDMQYYGIRKDWIEII